MNYKRSLFVAGLVAAILAEPMVGLAQSAPPLAAAPTVAPAAAAALARPRTVREGVVAIVNDDLISTYDLRQELLWLAITNGIQPSAETLPELQREALDALIDERLKAQELRRQAGLREKMKADGFFSTDAEVDDYLTQLAAQNKLTLKQFLDELAGRGVSPTALRWRMKVELSWEEFSRGFFGRRARVTEEQMKAVEDRIAESAAQPSYLISEIFIDAERAGGVQAAVNLGNQRLAQIQQGARFEAMARQYSARPTAASGGDAGWISAGEVPPAVAEALSTMRPGQITRPIPVTDGAYLVLLREKRAGGGQPVVNLKQAAVAVGTDASAAALQAAQTTLLAIKAKNPTCANLEAAAAGVQGVEVGDLGEAEVKDLSPTFRTAIENLQPGQVSIPVRTNIGLHLVAVCARRTSGANIPSRDQINNRLMAEQVTMLQRRELRDLRAAATISQPR